MVDKEEKGGGGLDPHQLLKALGSLLDSEGGAKGVPEILRIASLMKDARKLVARCVYANILKNTKSGEIMTKFVQVGGWETLNIWLQDAKAIANHEFIAELLHVYHNVPVTIELLKQNNCAKTIKQMSKSGDKSLVKRCSELVERWMAAIKAEPVKEGKQSSDSKKHRHHSSSEKKHKHSSSKHSDKTEKTDEPSAKKEKSSGEKEKSSQKSSSVKSRNHSESSKNQSHNSHLNTASKSDKNSDKSKSRHNSLDNRRDSDSSVTSSSSNTSSSQKSKSVMPSKPTDSKKTSSANDNIFASVLSSADKNSDTKKAKESTNKAKTAKTAPTKFRSTGLEQEVVLPPSKKKKSIENKNPVKRPSPLPKPSVQPPEKKPKSSPSGKEKAVLPTQEETHGKIKIIPPKPKPVEVFESSGFMDAIGASFVPQLPKIKRKKATPSVSTHKTAVTGNTSRTATSPPHSGSPTSPKDKMLPSFYKDTLASPTEKSANLSDGKTDSQESTAENDVEMKDDTKANEDAGSVAGSEMSTESVSKETGGGKKKKRVHWATERDLRSYFYFELDENERVNVNKVKNFEEIKKQETAMERMRLENAKKHGDQDDNSVPWKMMPLSDLPPSLASPGCNSTERETQKVREESVLQALFFNKHAIPPSPAEADPEDVPYEEPRILPLDDENGESGVIDHTSMEDSQSENEASPQFSLTPEVAAMLQNMAAQVGQSKSNDGNDANNGNHVAMAASMMPSPEELANLPPDMQNMIQSFMVKDDKQSNDDLIDKLKDILAPFNESQGMDAHMQGGYGQYPIQAQSLLPNPGPPPNMPPPMFGMPPPNFPGGRPPMGYGPPPGPPGWNRRGPLLGSGPPHMGGGSGPNNYMQRQRHRGPPRGNNRGGPGPGPGPTQLCRHFKAGKCDRDKYCGFLHPGVNGPK